jgi:ATP-dependent helicase/nuclease subunit A
VTSPLARGDDGHFARGLVTHKLLQVLPDLAQDQRAAAAERYVARHAASLSQDVRDEIVQETLAILNDPDFAPIFGPDSQAEVPLTGLLGTTQLISGQIDRLLVREDCIFIVDYKTNRPPPERAEDVPQHYYDQMRGYARALAQVYPDRDIKCALIWTDGPVMMPLDIS